MQDTRSQRGGGYLHKIPYGLVCLFAKSTLVDTSDAWARDCGSEEGVDGEDDRGVAGGGYLLIGCIHLTKLGPDTSVYIVEWRPHTIVEISLGCSRCA